VRERERENDAYRIVKEKERRRKEEVIQDHGKSKHAYARVLWHFSPCIIIFLFSYFLFLMMERMMGK
jgi:hypothetical protein